MSKVNSLDTVKVAVGRVSYDIDIVDGDLDVLLKKLKKISKTQKIVIVSNPTVWKLFEKRLNSAIGNEYDILLIIVRDGEKYKSLSEASKIYSKLIENGVMRNDLIIAFGGGVIGDLAGFIAATYLRGVNFIQIPTTLVAQVDSSIGGKVAVNHPKGKNMIGAFHQPRYVFADLSSLMTLPKREFGAGLSEVIKTALISSDEFFKFLEKNIGKIQDQEAAALRKAVRSSAEFKAKIVKIDEKDLGLRAILNFGHTFGHALEVIENYGTLLHGEGVSIGMVYAAIVSAELGYLKQKDVDRIKSLLIACDLPVKIPKGISFDQVLKQMGRDKKKVSAEITFITLKAIGTALIENVSEEILKKAFNIHKKT